MPKLLIIWVLFSHTLMAFSETKGSPGAALVSGILASIVVAAAFSYHLVPSVCGAWRPKAGVGLVACTAVFSLSQGVGG
jgi:hypothetical protein